MNTRKFTLNKFTTKVKWDRMDKPTAGRDEWWWVGHYKNYKVVVKNDGTGYWVQRIARTGAYQVLIDSKFYQPDLVPFLTEHYTPVYTYGLPKEVTF